jgi:ubiquinone/menaquinone biosynthesis C-methylase UbiE
MNHEDHINLLRQGIPDQGGIWADLGSGTGAFTLALTDLLGPSASIYSVDKDKGALKEQERAMRTGFPAVTVHYINADFTRRLDFPPLNGIVMANSLHFVREKNAVVQLIHSYLRPCGRLILVEYNSDRGNMWVPYPFSYKTWEALARQHGFASTRLLAMRPSRFLGEMYSALSLVDRRSA